MIAIATSDLDGAGIDRGGQIAPSGRSGLLAVGLVAVGLWLPPGFAAAADALQVTNARVPASDEVGIDLPLLMTIRNDAAEADAISRVRCPFANRSPFTKQCGRFGSAERFSLSPRIADLSGELSVLADRGLTPEMGPAVYAIASPL